MDLAGGVHVLVCEDLLDIRGFLGFDIACSRRQGTAAVGMVRVCRRGRFLLILP